MSWGRSPVNCANRLRTTTRPGRSRNAAALRLLRAGCCSLAVLMATAATGSASPRLAGEGVVFGSFDLGARGEKRAAGSILVACDEECPASFTLTLGASLNGGVPGRRRMRHTNGEGFLEYSLALEDEGGRAVESLTRKLAAGTALRIRVYAVVPPGQKPPSGKYSDRVTVTLEW